MHPDRFDQIRFFIQGGSFSEGLYEDYRRLYSDSDINRAHYSQFYVIDGKRTAIDGDWSRLPWQEVLDRADCIIVEINEAAVTGFTSGFVAALNAYLDTYVVHTANIPAVDRIVLGEANEIPEGSTSGFYTDGWTTDYFSTRLRGEAIENKGLDIEFTVMNEAVQGEKSSDDVRIYVNGQKVFENSFTGAWQGTVTVSPEQLAENKDEALDVYSVVIESSAGFIPFRFNINHDQRELFLRLNYLGPHRDETSEGGNG